MSLPAVPLSPHVYTMDRGDDAIPLLPRPQAGGGATNNMMSSYSSMNPPPPAITQEQLDHLLGQGYTESLALSLQKTKMAFALRIWIVDNSGSMQTADGERLVSTNSRSRSLQAVQCTRWEELCDCVEYHIQLASLLEAPTHFRFLNHPGMHIGPQGFCVGGIAHCGAATQSNYQQLDPYDAMQLVRRVQPMGCTPLSRHIREIHREISLMEPTLRLSGQRVVLVIATDGLPTNEQGMPGAEFQQEFIASLRLLEGLPVWLVVRLCTNDSTVGDFYNSLDSELELSIDVLDDFEGEGMEIQKINPWINYGLPLHRMREMGYQDRLMDLMDERPFTPHEIREFCSALFGSGKFDGVADPSTDWDGFCQHLNTLLKSEEMQWNPVKKRALPWIDTRTLKQIHGRQSYCPPLWLLILLLGLAIALWSKMA